MTVEEAQAILRCTVGRDFQVLEKYIDERSDYYRDRLLSVVPANEGEIAYLQAAAKTSRQVLSQIVDQARSVVDRATQGSVL